MKGGFLPDGIYSKLLEESHKHERPSHQLKLELLRFALKEKYGWVCGHDPNDPKCRKYSKNTKVFYCRNCGVLFEKVVGPRGIFFKEMPTCWELDHIANRPAGPLHPDMR